MSTIGDGYASHESIDYLERATELFRENKNDEAMFYLERAMRDPWNLEARILYAQVAPNNEETISRLVAAEAQGRRLLQQYYGSDCFTKSPQQGGCVGVFYADVERRPYMCVLDALSDMYAETENYPAAIEWIIEMLRLDSSDNVGKRFKLPTVFVLAGRYDEALSYAQAWMRTSAAHPDGLTPPSNVPLGPEAVDLQTRLKHGCAEHYYSAALAAFRIWGDCDIARQYLYIGAYLSPEVIRHVLTEEERPTVPVRRGRGTNNVEDANDYLYLAQHLWQVPEVWEWANAQEDVKRVLLRTCFRGNCDNREGAMQEFSRCSACQNVFYCSAECQRIDWAAHKKACKRSRMALLNFGRGLENGPYFDPYVSLFSMLL